jgi:DNA modification methylase
MGSGTVAKVCQDMKRNFIGLEINKKFIKLAEKRLK